MSSSAVLTPFRHVADVLHRDATAIAERWEAQARAVAPRVEEAGLVVEPGRAERVVRAVAGALGDGPCGHQELVRAGWDLGAGSHGDELSLHYLLKELSLLSAILLYAAERALAGMPAQPECGPAEGMAVARRLHKAVSLLTLAASKGFTHKYVTGLRDQYRMLRHDLRNPLGTIRSAITLMEDQSVAPEMRNDPRFRAMVTRNATSMEKLIGVQLGDSATQGSALARQEVSLLGVARAVRRDLREEAEERGCTIEIDESLPTREVDSVGLELALRALFAEALDAATPGSVLTVRADEVATGRAGMLITLEGSAMDERTRLPLSPTLVRDIGEWCGGRVSGQVGAARLEFWAAEATTTTATPTSMPAIAPTPARAAAPVPAAAPASVPD